ncbi:hypothetical protein [Buttiauxella gaviniae]|uniref:hypothetical protein n=1 Tax=Buttiauxella gaviniae TaxID=82990 RepID=UPI0039757F65
MDKGIEALIADLKTAAKESKELSSIARYKKGIDAKAKFDALATEENVLALIAALEQSHKEKSHLEYRLKNVQDAFLAGDERALRAERRVSELEKTLRGTEENLIAAVDQVAELESQPLCVKSNDAMREVAPLCVKLPEAYTIRPGHPINEGERGVMIPKKGGNWLSRFDVEHAIRVAGGTVEGGK